MSNEGFKISQKVNKSYVRPLRFREKNKISFKFQEGVGGNAITSKPYKASKFNSYQFFCNFQLFTQKKVNFKSECVKGNLHNSTPEGGAVCMPPFSILARKLQKTRIKTLAHMQEEKNMIFWRKLS